MAKKDNTLLIIGVGAVAAYLLLSKKTMPAPVVTTNSTGLTTVAKPVQGNLLTTAGNALNNLLKTFTPQQAPVSDANLIAQNVATSQTPSIIQSEGLFNDYLNNANSVQIINDPFNDTVDYTWYDDAEYMT